MPTYEYECLECKNRFDVFQSINDNPVEKCVKCNGKVRKLFGKAGIIFKGPGFYVTDYKKNDNGNKRSESNHASDSTSSCAQAESSPAASNTDKS